MKAPRADKESVLVLLRPGRPGLAGSQRIKGTRWFEVPAQSAAARARVETHPAVAQVSDNYMRGIDATPRDPLHKPKWGPPHYLRTIRAQHAWDLARGGTGQVIVVLDTGVALAHPDLKDSMLPGRDFVNGDAVASDDNGHGTSVAGIAAARANNGRGLAGVAWRASILPVKVLGRNGLGTDAQISRGIVWATDHGADVINMSFGGPASSGVLRDALDYAAKRGVVLVAAAGNTASAQRWFPAAHRDVLGVAATDWDGNATWFSAHGPAVDIAAPGYRILSTAVASIEGYPYRKSTGTSMAAPMVAGGAALLLAADPAMPAHTVITRLTSTARDAGLPGHDPSYGAGVLDVRAALDGSRQSRVVPARDAFEPNGVLQQAKPITSGSSVSATISPEQDVDWYVHDDTTGARLMFAASPPTPQDTEWWTRWGHRPAELDLTIAVYGADFRLLGEIDAEPATQTERLVLAPGISTRYYIRVSGSGAARGPGPYKLAVGWYDPNHADTAHMPYINYPVHGWAWGTDVADVTGDGRKDVLVTSTPGAHGGSEALWVYRQRNDGFTSLDTVLPLYKQTDPNITGNASVTTGDFDGDGRDDAIASTPAGLSVFWQRNGTLRGPKATGIAGTWPLGVDLDANARDEVLVRGQHRAYVARWTSSGWLREHAVDAPMGRDQEILDVTGDGVADLVTLASNGDQVLVNRGRGDRTFVAPGSTYAVGDWGGWGIGAGDVTGDGRNDVVVSGTDSSGGDYLRVLAQGTDGRLGPPRTTVTFAHPQSIDVADVNRDGRSDVVVVHGGYQAYGVHEQQADGTLGTERLAAAPYASHYTPFGLTVEDFTGDGYPDIAVADYNYGLVVLRRRSAGFPVPRATWVVGGSPDDAATGVATTTAPTVKFGPGLDPASVTTATVRLVNGDSGTAVPASVTYDAATRTATIRPSAPLITGAAYRIAVSGVRDTGGAVMDTTHETRFLVGSLSDTQPPQTLITGGPTYRTYRSYGPFFGFAATEPGTRFECRWASEPWIACTSPTFSSTGIDWNVTEATFEVRAIDGAGNADPTPAARSILAKDALRPPNDYFGGAAAIRGRSGSVTGTTDQAVDESWEPIHAAPGGPSVWYAWRAPFTGPVTFDTEGSEFDSLLAVYTGTAIENLRRVAADDDRGPGLTSRVRFRAREGTTYFIAVDGFYDDVYWSMGPLRLTWKPA